MSNSRRKLRSNDAKHAHKGDPCGKVTPSVSKLAGHPRLEDFGLHVEQEQKSLGHPSHSDTQQAEWLLQKRA